MSREQVNMLRSGQPQAEEAMSAILRDKINELLTENANLEKQVASLREAERNCLGDTTAVFKYLSEETIKRCGRCYKSLSKAKMLLLSKIVFYSLHIIG